MPISTMHLKFPSAHMTLVASLIACSQLGGCIVASHTRYRTTSNESTKVFPTRSVLLDKMGPPTKIQCKAEKQEIWTYQGESRWGGTFLWVIIIPLPLMVPIGTDSHEVTLNGEDVIKYKKSEIKICNMIAAVVLPNPIATSGGGADCLSDSFTVENRMTRSSAETFCTSERSAAQTKP